MARKETKSPFGWPSYRQNLLVLFDGITSAGPQGPRDRIEALFKETDFEDGEARPGWGHQWNLLNEIELRMFRLLDPAILRAETERKFEIARQEGVEGIAERRARFLEAESQPEHAAIATQRAIAIALLEDLFVRYSHRLAEREKRVEVSRRLTFLGLGVIALPTLLVFLVPLLELLLRGVGFGDEAIRQFFEMRWSSREYASFFVVMFFGAVGAYFSRLFVFARDMRSLKWNEMDTVYSRSALWVRLLVGAIAAVIVFFLMMGDILSGTLFLNGNFHLLARPECVNPTVQICETDPIVPYRPTADFARLVVWCTLAGFSERFLPDRLGEMEDATKGRIKAKID